MTDPKTFPFKKPSAQTPPALVLRAEELRAALRPLPANLLAARTGSAYTDFGQGKGEFRLSLFDSAVVGAYPALAFYSAAGDELPNFIQTILLYYFTTAAQNAGQAAAQNAGQAAAQNAGQAAAQNAGQAAAQNAGQAAAQNAG
ncbi:MAG: hypothetical protein EHM81_05090, partial [Chloroflexi bacterium]